MVCDYIAVLVQDALKAGCVKGLNVVRLVDVDMHVSSATGVQAATICKAAQLLLDHLLGTTPSPGSSIAGTISPRPTS